MGDILRRTDERRAKLDRRMPRQARNVVDEVQLRALAADGVMALAEHIMIGAQELDITRRMLAKGDPALNAILADIEARALVQVSKIQAQTFNTFGI